MVDNEPFLAKIASFMITATKRYSASVGRDTSKARTYANLFGYFKRNRWIARRDCNQVFGGALKTATTHLKKPVSDMRVLEIGHGQHATISLLFHSSGAKTTGIDMDYVRFGFSPKTYWRIFKLNGLERALTTLGRNILFDPGYYNEVQKCFGKTLQKRDLNLRRMNAADMDFADNTFDFVFSFAVFEHIADVESTAKEIARVLTSDGVASLSIDLFPSLSGGHNLEWAFPDDAQSKRVPAWDHLRDNLYPTHVYLNKLTATDYLEIFKRHFDVVECAYILEGRSLLTAELEQELTKKGYTRHDLLARSLRVVLHSKKQGR
ncbi:MAG: class I SAM-dependent methyltransferase [bacterium]|nr:class I SAM-dependent methyltransferase [bacterium]